jgi:hypothetical protein
MRIHFPRRALLVLLGFTLGACDPRFVRESDMSPHEIQELAGVWTGTGSLSSTPMTPKGTDAICPSIYLWTLRVAKGNVDGEIVDKETPRAPPSKFSAFVDFDGSIHAAARPDGRDTAILGSFQRSGSFTGTARSVACIYAVRLSRRGS